MTPLPALLSQVLVSFTIEFDNEFEHRIPHRTTVSKPEGQGKGPWLVSMVMWLNFMQYVSGDGVTLNDIQRQAGLKKEAVRMMLVRMWRWWGYVTLRLDGAIRPTPAGKHAQQIWGPLTDEIEERWQKRFGKQTLAELRAALTQVVRRLDAGLPAYLPILGYDFFARAVALSETAEDRPISLPVMLSRVLLAYTLEFESGWELSLPMCSNFLRVLEETGVAAKDMPRLGGVSKEAVAMALGYLTKRGYVSVGTAASSRKKVVRLMPKGVLAQTDYLQRVRAIDERWHERFGSMQIDRLRELLQPLTAAGQWVTYPDNWRAALPKPETLPHYPMVLHRGGYPDGS
jgi:DNA-binding MarR family transcriptional regulator